MSKPRYVKAKRSERFHSLRGRIMDGLWDAYRRGLFENENYGLNDAAILVIRHVMKAEKRRGQS